MHGIGGVQLFAPTALIIYSPPVVQPSKDEEDNEEYDEDNEEDDMEEDELKKLDDEIN